ncbi:head GIN domain-containing protein [Aquiflexum lacus]|uniref:head GIN domain-containing protein n=1 Tax=Aquiflexum lacus TaxID=2483805 RepID=UPI001892F8B4|nr:head GIN domain-containing protein [Aquiflexum lacus]
MKKTVKFILLLAFVTVGALQAQTQKDSRDLREFNAVKVSNSIKAELVKGDQNKVEITVSGIDVGNVETSVLGETLEIKLARGNFRNHVVSVVVTYVELLGIEANTSANVISKDPIVAQEAYLSAGTNAYLEAEVEADVLSVDASTNARIFVRGHVDELNVKAFTNAEIDGKNLTGKQIELQANTAATIHFNATSTIEGSVATAAKVYYGGNPKNVDVKTTTGGSIQKR